ncbi:uncharacterized protein LOC144952033 [Lampetra fluviatilis]
MSDSEEASWEDCPGLVSSDDEEELDDYDKPAGPMTNEEAASHWVAVPLEARVQHHRTAMMYLYGPLLFMSGKMPTKLMEVAKQHLTNIDNNGAHFADFLWQVGQAFMQNSIRVEFTVAVLGLYDKIQSCDMQEALEAVERTRAFVALKESSVQLERHQRLTVYLLLCCTYGRMLKCLFFKGVNLLREFENRCWQQDQLALPEKEMGNLLFRDGKFNKAIECYTNGISVSPYNHVLYGNRAICFIRVRNHSKALSDARKAVVLKPDWPKAHYRYVEAVLEVHGLHAALHANQRGVDLCRLSGEKVGDLVTQGDRLRDQLATLAAKRAQETTTSSFVNVSRNLREWRGGDGAVLDDDQHVSVSVTRNGASSKRRGKRSSTHTFQKKVTVELQREFAMGEFAMGEFAMGEFAMGEFAYGPAGLQVRCAGSRDEARG